MKAEVVSTHSGGMWSWLFQRITAVLLIVCLTIHLIFTHIFSIGELSYENVANRLAHGTLTAVDIILLMAAIYHALNGLRMVLLDYWLTSRVRARAVTYALWAVGIAFLIYGIWGLWPWIGY